MPKIMLDTARLFHGTTELIMDDTHLSLLTTVIPPDGSTGNGLGRFNWSPAQEM